MNEVILYEALDGSLFEDKDICEKYESAIKKSPESWPGIKLFDLHGAELDLRDATFATSAEITNEDIANGIMNMVEIISSFSEDIGENVTAGTYIYSDVLNKWVKKENDKNKRA